MPDYRRYFVPGGTYFFTIVTQRRRRLFSDECNVQRLRETIRCVKRDWPFTINAAVVLPDHLHFIWSLPPGDADYSKRIGLMKVRFSKSITSKNWVWKGAISQSRRKHRESNVWQRRFWEHTIQDEDEFESFFDYIHYNPVRHQLASCPHSWTLSSFHYWTKAAVYDPLWGCCCENRIPEVLGHLPGDDLTGEPVD